MPHIPRPALLIIFALLLAGCSPIVLTGQPERAGFASLSATESVGQTFTARYDGLSGVAVFFKPGAGGDGQALLRLRRSPQEETDLAQAVIPAGEVTRPGYYRFWFPPQSGSAGRDYYVQIEFQGQGDLQIGLAGAESYPDGALYQGGEPQEAQLTFRLAYEPGPLLSGLAADGLSWLALAAAGLFLFVLPGWGLLGLLLPGWSSLGWGEKLGLSAGLSLALYPLLTLWTGILGLRPGLLYAWAPGLAGLAAVVWKRMVDARRMTKDDGRRTEEVLSRSSFISRPMTHLTPSSFVLRPSSIALLAVISLTFAVRFWAVRGLDIPLWGDSYHHTVISQLLVDHGGLFDSWEPYGDSQTFTYHFGFHTAAAVLAWLARLPAPQAVLWAGQILNGLAVLAIYPLAARIGRGPWAGVAAVLIAGLLSPMPMFYTNWGRYTQLAGQVILPAAMYLAVSLLEARSGARRWAILAALAMGGLALTHYRILILGVIFFGSLLLLSLRRGALLRPFVRTALAGIGAGVLFLPWFIHVYSGKILAIFASQVSTPASQTPSATQEFNEVGNLLAYLPAWLWLLAALALLLGFLRREKGAYLFGLWSLLVLLAANPNWLSLPGIGSLGNFTVLIAAYLPAAVLIGGAVGWIVGGPNPPAPFPGDKERRLREEGEGAPAGTPASARPSSQAFSMEDTPFSTREGGEGVHAGSPASAQPPTQASPMKGTPFYVREGGEGVHAGSPASAQPPTQASPIKGTPFPGREGGRGVRSLPPLLLSLTLLLGLWGASQRIRDVRPGEYALVTRPDQRAAGWIRENTPAEARFLVHSFLAFGDMTAVGSDAGWWLPLLAGRETNLPPMNYVFEAELFPGYYKWVNQPTALLQEKAADDPQVLQLLRERGITHVYIGQKQGRVNASGTPALEPERLLASPHFEPVYHQDRVWIFEVKQ